MPSQSLRPCTYPGCNVLVKSGRCAKHQAADVQRDPDVKKLYNDPRWQVMRVAQLSEQPWCADCLSEDEKHVYATDVDHIQPHRGDPELFFDPGNVQSLCHVHHSRKTAQEVWHSDK
jgi:5-methylcytosine-specific restriction protein A